MFGHGRERQICVDEGTQANGSGSGGGGGTTTPPHVAVVFTSRFPSAPTMAEVREPHEFPFTVTVPEKANAEMNIRIEVRINFFISLPQVTNPIIRPRAAPALIYLVAGTHLRDPAMSTSRRRSVFAAASASAAAILACAS